MVNRFGIIRLLRSEFSGTAGCKKPRLNASGNRFEQFIGKIYIFFSRKLQKIVHSLAGFRLFLLLFGKTIVYTLENLVKLFAQNI